MHFFTYKKALQSAQRFVVDNKAFRASGGSPYYVSDSELGWTIAPNVKHSSRPYTSDGNGFRITEAGLCENDRPVVSVWGDSMVHGDGVDDSDSWPWLLADQISNRFRVLNGGVSGYGSDQGLLRLKKLSETHKPDIAFLSYATTDLFRHVNVYRTFLHHDGDFPFLKPRYAIEGKRPKLIRPPQTDEHNVVDVLEQPGTQSFLKAYDLIYPSYLHQFQEKVARNLGLLGLFDLNAGIKRQALQVTEAIFSDFKSYCSANNIRCAAILLPAYYGKNPTGSDFDWLIRKFESIGLDYLDLRYEFREQSKYEYKDLYVQGNHYGRRSGEWVSNRIAAYLDKDI